MRVLVTRPEPGGKRTAERLAGLGHDPVRMPLFESKVTAAPDDLPPAASISRLIATSARAFSIFREGDVSRAGIGGVPVHAVGPATAQAARDAGFLHVEEAGGTAQALSESLAALQGQENWQKNTDGTEAAARSPVYLAGVPRTPVLETALEAQNTPLQVVECYKMDEISYSTDIIKAKFLSPPLDVVLLYSANAARRFSALVEVEDLASLLDSTRFICLSGAISGQLPGIWRDRSIIAGRPDEDSMLASLAALG